MIAVKKKYKPGNSANLKELLDKRDAIRKEEILSAVVKSGRSYEEIMNFLNAGSDGEKTENRIILSRRYSDIRFSRKKLEVHK
mgnify:CR=1 FL=1